jgi:predicted glutamine amidotransferase
MVAKISAETTSIYEELENCPYSLHWLSAHGKQSKNPEQRGTHNDGCGLAWFEEGKLMLHKRGKDRFWDESFARAAQKARAKIFIAHDRQASGGLLLDERGAHPFKASIDGRAVALCHNGAVRNLIDEAIARGTSDSEIFLEKIAEETSTISFRDMHETISRMSLDYDYTSMTSFLLTPDRLFAWRVYNAKDEANRERYEKYYTLYMSNRSNHVLIASEPIDNESNWELIPNMTFIEITSQADGVKLRQASLN